MAKDRPLRRRTRLAAAIIDGERDKRHRSKSQAWRAVENRMGASIERRPGPTRVSALAAIAANLAGLHCEHGCLRRRAVAARRRADSGSKASAQATGPLHQVRLRSPRAWRRFTNASLPGMRRGGGFSSCPKLLTSRLPARARRARERFANETFDEV